MRYAERIEKSNDANGSHFVGDSNDVLFEIVVHVQKELIAIPSLLQIFQDGEQVLDRPNVASSQRNAVDVSLELPLEHRESVFDKRVLNFPHREEISGRKSPRNTEHKQSVFHKQRVNVRDDQEKDHAERDVQEFHRHQGSQLLTDKCEIPMFSFVLSDA